MTSHLSEWPSLISQQTNDGKAVEKREPSFTVGGYADCEGAATVENSMEFPQKFKNGTAF